MIFPKISIIVPVYNAEQYLHHCIDSILVQTYTNFELLLIDDGSTDSSGSICDEYAKKDSRVRVFHKTNGGVSSARNFALDKAEGEYIGWVDADDWIEPNMYEKMYNSAIDNQADIVYCNFFKENNNKSFSIIAFEHSENKATLLNNYIMNAYCVLYNTLIKRDLYTTHKLRAVDGLDYCEDQRLSIMLYYHAKTINHVNESLYYYRYNAKSICNSHNPKKGISYLKNYTDIVDFFKPKDIYPAIKKSIAYRGLLAKRHLLYTDKDIKAWINTFSDFNEFVLSNPLYGKKGKLIEWLIIKSYMFQQRLLKANIQ